MSFPLIEVEWGQLFQLNTTLLRNNPSRKISARVLLSYLKTCYLHEPAKSIKIQIKTRLCT